MDKTDRTGLQARELDMTACLASLSMSSEKKRYESLNFLASRALWWCLCPFGAERIGRQPKTCQLDMFVSLALLSTRLKRRDPHDHCGSFNAHHFFRPWPGLAARLNWQHLPDRTSVPPVRHVCCLGGLSHDVLGEGLLASRSSSLLINIGSWFGGSPSASKCQESIFFCCMLGIGSLSTAD